MLLLTSMLGQAILVVCSPASGRSAFPRNPSQPPFLMTGYSPTGDSQGHATGLATGSGIVSQPTGVVVSGAAERTGLSPLLPITFGGTAISGVFPPSGSVISSGISGLVTSEPIPTSLEPVTPVTTLVSSNVAATGGLIPSLNLVIVNSVTIVSDPFGVTTKTEPMIVGGGIIAPKTAISTSSLDPSGDEASSLAHVFQTQIIYATRAVQSWTVSPSNSASQTRAIEAVKSAESLGASFFIRLNHGGDGGGGTGSSGPCSGGNLLTTLFDAVSCATKGLGKLGSDIGGGIKSIEEDLKSLQMALPPLDPKLPVPNPPAKPSPDTPSDNSPKPSSDPSLSEPSRPSSNSAISTGSASESPSSTASTECSSTITVSKCSAICTASSSCTTTCYSTMQGCNVTGTTVTSSATTTPSRTQYLVFASKSADANSINNFLSSKVVEPSAVMYLPPDDSAGIAAFWAIPGDPNAGSTAGLNQSQVGDIERQPGINFVMTNAAYFEVPEPSVSVSELIVTETPNFPIETPLQTDVPQSRRDVSHPKDLLNAKAQRSLSRRENALVLGQLRKPGDLLDVPFELRAVSQPRDIKPRPGLDNLDYFFLWPAGQGTWVYVADRGVRKTHIQFNSGCDVVPENEWIIVQENLPENLLRDDSASHGTGVTSKICGRNTGVAKHTTIIPVKFFPNKLLDSILIWRLIKEDIDARRKKMPRTALPGKTVINYSSVGTYKDLKDQRGIEEIKKIMKSLMSLGVVIVVAAGNDRQNVGGNPAILEPPAIWASDEFPIIVVSSVDQNFNPSSSSNYGTQTSVWAIGEKNLVATNGGDMSYTHADGTSLAAGQVTGLISNYLSLPVVPFKTAPADSISLHVWELFRTGEGAYAREKDGMRILWNQHVGNSKFLFLCDPSAPSMKGKRDTGLNDMCELPQPSTLTTSPTSTQQPQSNWQQSSSTIPPPPPPPPPPSTSSMPPPPPPAPPTPPVSSPPTAVPSDTPPPGPPPGTTHTMPPPSPNDIAACLNSLCQLSPTAMPSHPPSVVDKLICFKKVKHYCT